MGMRLNEVKLIYKAQKILDISWKELKLCEYGNQHLRLEYYNKKWQGFGIEASMKTGKRFVESLGAKHISVDINGRDGSIQLDLSKPIKRWKYFFDIGTNFGTCEHVSDHYIAFYNFHNFVRVGGIFLHTLPMVGSWKDHGFLHYGMNFVTQLKDSCDYDLVDTYIVDRGTKDTKLISCVLRKMKHGDFVTRNVFDTFDVVRNL